MLILVVFTASTGKAIAISEFWPIRQVLSPLLLIQCAVLCCVQEGSVTLLRFSASENALAVCCGKDHVSLWELNLTEQGISKVRDILAYGLTDQLLAACVCSVYMCVLC